MTIFSNKPKYPELPDGNYDVVLRCSICNGEQVLCLKDRDTGELRELMLVKNPDDVEGFCKAESMKLFL